MVAGSGTQSFAVFIWITEEVEFCFPADLMLKEGVSVELFIATCSCMESRYDRVKDTEKGASTW